MRVFVQDGPAAPSSRLPLLYYAALHGYHTVCSAHTCLDCVEQLCSWTYWLTAPYIHKDRRCNIILAAVITTNDTYTVSTWPYYIQRTAFCLCGFPLPRWFTRWDGSPADGCTGLLDVACRLWRHGSDSLRLLLTIPALHYYYLVLLPCCAFCQAVQNISMFPLLVLPPPNVNAVRLRIHISRGYHPAAAGVLRGMRTAARRAWFHAWWQCRCVPAGGARVQDYTRAFCGSGRTGVSRTAGHEHNTYAVHTRTLYATRHDTAAFTSSCHLSMAACLHVGLLYGRPLWPRMVLVYRCARRDAGAGETDRVCHAYGHGAVAPRCACGLSSPCWCGYCLDAYTHIAGLIQHLCISWLCHTAVSAVPVHPLWSGHCRYLIHGLFRFFLSDMAHGNITPAGNFQGCISLRNNVELFVS